MTTGTCKELFSKGVFPNHSVLGNTPFLSLWASAVQARIFTVAAQRISGGEG